MLNNNWHHEPTFFYYSTENWLKIGFYFSFRGKKTTTTKNNLSPIGIDDIWLFKGELLSVQAFPGDPSPSCLSAHSTAPPHLHLSVLLPDHLLIVPWKVCVFPRLHLCCCLPSLLNCTLLFPSADPSKIKPLQSHQLVALVHPWLSRTLPGTCEIALLTGLPLKLLFSIQLSLFPSTKKIIH